MSGIPHISDTQIRALALQPGEVRRAVAAAFQAHSAGDAELVPKLALKPRRGGQFHAMPASVGGLAAVKWLNIAAERQPDRPYLQATMLCTDVRSGATVALLDAEWITAIRAAAVSALAVDVLSAAEVDAFAIIGCGLQARTHLAALRDVRPIRRLTCCSARRETAERYAVEARALGLEAVVLDDPDAVLAATPITVVASPITLARPGFLDARRARAGSVTVALDLGVAFAPESLGAFDAVYTDDLETTKALVDSGMVRPVPRLDGGLAELEAGATALRATPAGRTLFLPPGVALADVAVARLVLERYGLWHEQRT